jgi:hypothetical protein
MRRSLLALEIEERVTTTSCDLQRLKPSKETTAAADSTNAAKSHFPTPSFRGAPLRKLAAQLLMGPAQDLRQGQQV